jgi:NADH:ubiquinone oxidoreductase subunit 5 (subunit L)/multisubunit Na+/H+ antiporter MnhA subunit
LLVIGAFLTAFYMWRLVSLVFLGEFRGSHEVLHHAHEAPFAMRMPLVVLAVCSILVGFFGVPHFLGGSNKIERWLEPAVTAGYVSHDAGEVHAATETEAHAENAAAEWAATAVAMAAGLGGLALGHYFYRVRPELPAATAARAAGLYRLVANKYWVDEIYGAVIVRPFYWLSDRILWRIIDMRIIDGLVNLLTGFTRRSRTCSGSSRAVTCRPTSWSSCWVFWCCCCGRCEESFVSLLSSIIFLPSIVAVLVLLLPRSNDRGVRLVTLLGMLASFATTLMLIGRFQPAGGMQLVERATWIESASGSNTTGCHGISLWFVLTGLLGPIATPAS